MRRFSSPSATRMPGTCRPSIRFALQRAMWRRGARSTRRCFFTKSCTKSRRAAAASWCTTSMRRGYPREEWTGRCQRTTATVPCLLPQTPSRESRHRIIPSALMMRMCIQLATQTPRWPYCRTAQSQCLGKRYRSPSARHLL